MQNKSIVYIIVGLALIAGLFVLLRPKQQGGQTNSPPPPPASKPAVRTFNLFIKDKKLISGPPVITLQEGDEVKIIITADEDEELHIHGYDISADLEKDKPVEVVFTATLTGRFIYELEHSKTDIGVIEVAPK